MFGGTVGVPMVIRAPGGAGAQLTAQHSQSLEGWFAGCPGLKVVAPATPADAYGMLKTAIRDDDPVLFCENLVMYNVTGTIPDDPGYTVPFGRAQVIREGSDLTLVAHSYTVQRALRVADRLAQDGVAAEVVDLRSLRPLDVDTVAESVRKTNRVVVAEEGWSTYGVGAELAARISSVCFDDLDAPVQRVGSAEVPMPYSKPLERAALPLESRSRRRRATCSRSAASSRAMAEELVMPRLSDTMEQGTIGRWLVHEGDAVAEGDVIAEIETDKATMEFQAYAAGTVLRSWSGTARRQIWARPSRSSASRARRCPRVRRSLVGRQAQASGCSRERAPAGLRRWSRPPPRAAQSGNGACAGAVRVSPIARRMADEAGLDLGRLAGSGAGPDGRIVKVDVERLIAGARRRRPPAESAAGAAAPSRGGSGAADEVGS